MLLLEGRESNRSLSCGDLPVIRLGSKATSWARLSGGSSIIRDQLGDLTYGDGLTLVTAKV